MFSSIRFIPRGIERSFHTNHSNVLFTVQKEVDESWRPVKEKFLNMDIDDKRQHYYVKGNYLDLERTRPWPVYYARIKPTKTTKTPKYSIHFPDNFRVSMGKANLVGMELDVIVNSASQDLMGNGGKLDKLIHLAAGPELKAECFTLRGCDIGEAKITGGYRLPAKYVIHTVGPIGENEAQLNACYKSCLAVMKNHRLRTICFPCISTATNRYPSEAAAHIALDAIRKFLHKNPDTVDRIALSIHRERDLAVYWDLMQVYFPVN